MSQQSGRAKSTPAVRDTAQTGVSPFISYLARARTPLESTAWLIGTLGIATLLTWLRVRFVGDYGLPLAFYLPAIGALALLAGWEFGLAAMFFSIAIVWAEFTSRFTAFAPLTLQQAGLLLVWCVVCATMLAVCYILRVSLARLARSENRYRKLADVLSDILWVTDAQGNIHEPRSDWARVTGTAWPDYAGRRWLESVHEEDRAALEPHSEMRSVEFRLWDVNAGDWRWYRLNAVPLTGDDGQIAEWIMTMREIHEAKLARERNEIVVGESRHRLKNLITIIEALAKSSRSRRDSSAELDAYMQRFLGRLHALGATADLVLAGQHDFLDTAELVRVTLAPFMEEDAGRITVNGPRLQLSEATGGSLALAVHELATNAIKYGALSNGTGTVSISWNATRVGEGEDFVFEWKERGGPPPQEPQREGFGVRVIKSVPAREKAGDVRIEYQPDGLYCRIAFHKKCEPVSD